MKNTNSDIIVALLSLVVSEVFGKCLLIVTQNLSMKQWKTPWHQLVPVSMRRNVKSNRFTSTNLWRVFQSFIKIQFLATSTRHYINEEEDREDLKSCCCAKGRICAFAADEPHPFGGCSGGGFE